MNSNFICYQGVDWVRTFQFVACSDDFDLAGYLADIYITAPDGTSIIHLSVGSGISISGSIITASMSAIQTAALSIVGLPIKTVTEVICQSCCDGILGGQSFDTKTGPTANIRLVMTDPSGSVLPPSVVGLFLIFPES